MTKRSIEKQIIKKEKQLYKVERGNVYWREKGQIIVKCGRPGGLGETK